MQLEAAIADGLDVRGLMYWTLVDNFEWAFGVSGKVWSVRVEPNHGPHRPPGAAQRQAHQAPLQGEFLLIPAWCRADYWLTLLHAQ